MKRLLSLFLCAAMLFSLLSVCAYADDTPGISVSTASAYQGNTATVYINAQNFAAVGSAEFALHYDADAFSVLNTNTGSMIDSSNSFLSVNAENAGVIRMSAMSVDGFSASGRFLQVNFRVAEDCAPGTYPLELTVGQACGVDLSDMTLSKVSGSITVTKQPVSSATFYVTASRKPATAQKGDTVSFQLINGNRYSFAAGEFVIGYDDTRLAVDSVQLGDGLQTETAQYSINTASPGTVRFTYAAADAVNPNCILYVSFQVIGDVDGTTTVSYAAANVYDDAQKAYLPYKATSSIALKKLPEVIDYPDLWLETEQPALVGQQMKASLKLEKGAGVAAGDFTVSYDPDVLRCVSVSPAADLANTGGMIIVDENYTDGTIEFPYVNAEGYCAADIALIDIVWEVLQSPTSHTVAVAAGSMVYDVAFSPVTLEYVPAECCLMKNTGTAAADDPLSTVYACASCANSVLQPRCLTEVKLTALPDKLTYITGLETLDLTGGAITCYYDNGTQSIEPLTESMVTGFDSTAVGTQTLSVLWQDTVNTFDITVRKALVTFKNWDGTLIAQGEYLPGDTVTPPAEPARPADETYTYSFAQWQPQVTVCAGDAVYTASYTPVYIDYAVKFLDWDGTVLQESTYHYGDDVTPPKAPVRQPDAMYSYVFTGWDTPVTPCSGNGVYTAVYTPVANEYTVVFQNWDGTLLSEKTYHYGDPVEAPETPVREADQVYTYRFAGWNTPVVPCEGNTVYTATYTPFYIAYTVTFQNWDGTVLQESTYHYGDDVMPPEAPAKDADHTYTYAFAGWDKEVVSCVADAVYTAVFEPVFIDYTVVFQNADGSVLSEKTYHYGDPVEIPDAPEVPGGTDPTWVFKGWDAEVSGICVADAVYTAVFGEAYPRGDMNCDFIVTDADAIYLLRHTLFQEDYPIFQSGDFNNDAIVTDADAIYLLRHTLFPEDWPLN